jgi:pyruvate,water dikinase
MGGEHLEIGPDPLRRRRRAEEPSPVVASGKAVGGRRVTGVARFVDCEADLDDFRPGEILLAEITLPEWLPVLEQAAAIVTNQGGKASHAALAARQLGVPAVVGTVSGASRLWTGATITVCCADGDVGRVYEGAHPPEPGEGPHPVQAGPAN